MYSLIYIYILENKDKMDCYPNSAKYNSNYGEAAEITKQNSKTKKVLFP